MRLGSYDGDMEHITSTTNQRIKAVRRLHSPRGRKETGATICEGPNLLDALVESGVVPLLVLALADDRNAVRYAEEHDAPCFIVTEDVLAAAAESVTPQSPIVMMEIPRRSVMRTMNTVVLDGLGDPGNVGTIIRTATAFGWDVAISRSTADPWAPKALRSSAGAAIRAHIAAVEDPVAEAKRIGLECVGTVVVDGGPLDAVHRPTALFIGSEARGLAGDRVESMDRTVTIPMAGGTESLNAASAAAIAMYVMSGI